MNYKKFKNIKLSTLGMGNMRLPLVNGEDPNSLIDWKKAHEIIDYAYDHGVTYFDTAYVYNKGESERCLGECMKKHPRDSFYIATKFFIGANPDYKAVFEEQLERLQTDHIDFYLIHCLMDGNCDQYLESGAIEYFLEQQKKGRIRYLGFSSHAGTGTLERFASHHKWDFAQLQINYFDWNYAETKKEYEILQSKGIPTVVMEPVRGGKLASLTPEANALLNKAHPDWSIASWALRWVSSLPNVQVVLSGMSSMDQVKDNVNTFSSDYKFTAEDEKILFEACHLFKSQINVPCTGCRYCCDGCPVQINIPEYLKVYNAYKIGGVWELDGVKGIKSEGKPSDCLQCYQCTSHCPQSIKIPEIMKELSELIEKNVK